MKTRTLSVLVVLLFIGAILAFAHTGRQLERQDATKSAKRMELVIGNGNYLTRNVVVKFVDVSLR